MPKKLIASLSKSFIAFVLIILIVAFYLFYFFTKQIYIKDVKAGLVLNYEDFYNNRMPNFQLSDIPNWNHYNNESEIKFRKESKEIVFKEILVFDRKSNNYEPYMVIEAPIMIEGKRYTYYEKSNLVEPIFFLKNGAIIFLIMILAISIGVYFITREYSITLWRLLRSTLSKIEKFELDMKVVPQFDETPIHEINKINACLDRNLKRQVAAFKSQREFVDNAAHELQTPLAVFKTKLDELMQSGEYNDNQIEILHSITKNVSRLNRLNKNLLLLSKLEHNTFTSTEEVNFKEIIETQYEFLEEQINVKKISIEFNLNDLLVVSNSTLVEVLIQNLFVNAIRHNMEGGKIIVSIVGNVLTFSNSSNNLALEKKKLFNRFKYDSNNPSIGSGLGLSIIKRIISFNEWGISYHFEKNLHKFVVIT